MEKDRYGFEDRKKILQSHLDKFHQLRKEGKLQQAMDQFSKTMDYAKESMNHSSKVLQKSIAKIQNLNSEDKVHIKNVATKAVENSEIQRDVLKDLLKNNLFFRV